MFFTRIEEIQFFQNCRNNTPMLFQNLHQQNILQILNKKKKF